MTETEELKQEIKRLGANLEVTTKRILYTEAWATDTFTILFASLSPYITQEGKDALDKMWGEYVDNINAMYKDRDDLMECTVTVNRYSPSPGDH